MSDDNKGNTPQPIRSVFDESETPEEGANFFDEAPDTSAPTPDTSETEPDPFASLEEEDLAEDDIKEKILEDGNLDLEADLGDTDLFDHSEEINARKEQDEKDGVAPPPLPESDPVSYQNPAMLSDPAEAVRDEIESRFTEEFQASKVSVKPAEREAFVRAALHDSELQFNVKVEGVGATVTIAMPSDHFTSAVTAAAYSWAKDGHISADSDLQWILSFQQMHAWFQVRAVNGVPTSWASDWADGIPSAKQLQELLNNPENLKDIQSMSGIRWRLMLQAIRIAEQKYKICLNNWHDRTFFTGADTD